MRIAAAFLLLFVCSCTKDTILLEQVTIELKAITEFTSTCNDLYAHMESDLDVIVFSLPYSLHTNDDFQTLSYKESSQDAINCGTETIYFDGTTCWVRQPVPFPVTLERHSFDGTGYLLLQGDYSEFTFSPAVSSSDTKTRIPFFFDYNRFMVGTRAFGAPAISIYETNVASKTASLVGTTHTVPSTFTPMSIHRAGDTWLVIGFDYLDVRDYSVITSPDLANWQGPFFMAELPASDYWIDQTSGDGDLMVARGINTTSQNTGTGHLYLVSVDQGHTWSSLAPSMGILHAQVVGNGTIYAVIRQGPGDRGTISKLAKSTDSGATWTQESPLFYGDRISFHDLLNGLAMAGGTLQITHDGGKSWTLVLTTP